MTKLVKMPDIWERISDDTSPRINEISFESRVADDRNKFLLVLLNGTVAGFFSILNMTPGVYEVHTVLLDSCHGSLAVTAVKMAMDWMYANTNALMLTTFCPDYLPQALTMALACGGKKLGYVPNVIMKNGLPYGVTQVYLMKEG
jgi:hypothetical protein